MVDQIEEQGPAARGTALPDEMRRVEALERENGQLREALASRIVIEQAKGVLAERFRLDVERSFELLRRSARSERRRIHELAAEIIRSRRTPIAIEASVAEIGSLGRRTGASRG